ncbi:CdiA family toxin C-terminal domain-containing protein [Paenibacillus sp. KS-LC4]|uniref:CdiA family toxin C-terminal domain-containing protein n=1 Tax=Paenibacillus sp. KS-LC4 TaxID=2979727 RepID=UPI0030CEC637
MAGKQVVFKPDEVRRLQQQMVRIGADTDELRRRVSGKIASWDRSLPMLSSLEQIQRQLTGLTQEAEQMTEVISKALKGIERVQAEAAQEAKQLAKGLSGLERFDLLKRVGTTGGGSYTPVPVTFRPMVTNLIDRILPQASRDRWSSDPLVKELRRVAGLQGATAAEKLDAEMKLEAIFAERDLIAKAQTAYAVYKQFGNHLLMAEMHKQAEISREKLKELGVAESYFAPNVNMTSYFKQVPLLACDYDPSFALEGDLTTRVPLPDNARYLFMVMMAQTQGPTGELARVQLKEIHALQQTIRTAAGGLVANVQQGQVKGGLKDLLTILQASQALSKYGPQPKEPEVPKTDGKEEGALEKFWRQTALQVTQSLADGWKQIQAEGQEVLDGFQEKTAQLENLLSEGLTNGKQIVIEGYNQAETWLNDMYADLEPTLSQGKQGFYNFSGGFIAAVDDAMFFGLAQHVVESNNEGSGMAKDTVGYQLGKVTGDTVMLVGGLMALAGGIGGEVGGTALYATGFGALAGAPIQVASWGLLVGGGTVVVQSGKNIPGDVGDLFSNIWKSDSGPKSKGDIDVPKVDAEGTGNVKFSPNLDNHIIKVDTTVPRSRGIGGAHNRDEFMNNNINITNVEPHPTMAGVEKITYQVPSIDGKTGEITGWKATSFKKTVYDPKVISDQDYLKYGKEAANNAATKGTLGNPWVGYDSNGVKWMGYSKDGEVTSFFPEF